MKRFDEFLTEGLTFFTSGIDKISSNKWQPLYKSTRRFEVRILYIPRIRRLVAFEPMFLHEVASVRIAVDGINGKQVAEDGDVFAAGIASMVIGENKNKEYQLILNHGYRVYIATNSSGNRAARAQIIGETHLAPADAVDIKKSAFALRNDVSSNFAYGQELHMRTRKFIEEWAYAIEAE